MSDEIKTFSDMAGEFKPFPKMARLSRECIITEKIDGTNAQIFIDESGTMKAGSRTQWITIEKDNFGFARWCDEHYDELLTLGPGRHFGEWWGSGIQRGYGLPKGERRFSLFNVQRWVLAGQTPQQIITGDPRQVKVQEVLPPCVGLVPILYRGPFSILRAETAIAMLAIDGSYAAPGFMKPEGIVVWHCAANVGFKKTIFDDEGKRGNSQP